MIKAAYCIIDNFDNRNIDIKNKEREKYVLSIKDERRKIQSALVWKLLEFLLSGEVNGFDTERLKMRDEKWVDEDGEFFISLSHSHGVVAAAISDVTVGIDVELKSDRIFSVEKKFENIKLNESFDDKTAELTFKWTATESVYKAGKRMILTNETIIYGKNEYCITLNGETKAEIRSVDLSDIL